MELFLPPRCHSSLTFEFYLKFCLFKPFNDQGIERGFLTRVGQLDAHAMAGATHSIDIGHLASDIKLWTNHRTFLVNNNKVSGFLKLAFHQVILLWYSLFINFKIEQMIISNCEKLIEKSLLNFTLALSWFFWFKMKVFTN